MAGLVGVDIGGSGVRAAVVDESGRPGPIEAVALAERSVEAVVDATSALASALQADRLGVGVPGFVRDGAVIASPNFPAWRGVPLAQLLGDRLGIPVHVENDANAAAWGAWRVRGGQGDLIMLTLGTGVGGGVVSEGRLLRGAGGTGAEVGHIYVGGDRPCGCGGIGCLETRCSTVGLQRAASEVGQSVIEGAEVVRLAEAGVPWARDAMSDAALALGRGLVTLVNIFNPDRILIAGGLAAAADHLAPGAESWLRDHGIAASVERVAIEWEARAEAYAIPGAASLARAA